MQTARVCVFSLLLAKNLAYADCIIELTGDLFLELSSMKGVNEEAGISDNKEVYCHEISLLNNRFLAGPVKPCIYHLFSDEWVNKDWRIDKVSGRKGVIAYKEEYVTITISNRQRFTLEWVTLISEAESLSECNSGYHEPFEIQESIFNEVISSFPGGITANYKPIY